MATSELDKYKDVRKTVVKKRVFRIFQIHLLAYVLGMITIGLWNAGTFYLRDNDTLWFYLPLLFWGLGVMIHYVLAVGLFDEWWERDESVIGEQLS